jgi:hypothetical protein
MSPHKGEVLQNALMMSPAQHPFWLYAMREVLSNAWSEDVFYSTGPRIPLYASLSAPADMTAWLPANGFSRWPGRRRKNDAHGETAVQLYEGKSVYAIHLGTCWWCSGNPSVDDNPAIRIHNNNHSFRRLL